MRTYVTDNGESDDCLVGSGFISLQRTCQAWEDVLWHCRRRDSSSSLVEEFSDRVEVGLFCDSESDSMASIVGQESCRYARHFCCAVGLSTSHSWKYHVQKVTVGQFHLDLRLCRGAHLPARGEGVAAGRSSRKLASCRRVLLMRCFKTSWKIKYQTKSSLESNFICESS